jgi:hypothetical protein
MKTYKELTEELKPATEHMMLVEEVAAINDTGFLTEDLVTIIETHRKNEWSEGLDADEFKQHLRMLKEEALRGE